MKKNNIIIAVIAVVFVFLLLAIGTLSYTLISNNNKAAALAEEDKLNQLVEEKLQEKEQEADEAKKEAEKKKDKEKAEKNKANFITIREAYEGSTQRGVAAKPLSCEITAKEKKIPSNVDQKAEGGMITCVDNKYRVYIGNDSMYNYYTIGDTPTFEVRWIESNLYYFYVDTYSEY